MITVGPEEWSRVNKAHLLASLDVVRGYLSARLSVLEDGPASGPRSDLAEARCEKHTHACGADAVDRTTLGHVCAAFGLSPFERHLLVMCAGVELDSAFAELCATVQGSPSALPTFSLALSTLPDAHWSALVPAAPLRRWRLVHVGEASRLTSSPLRIDERVLHYLAGVEYLDEDLDGVVAPVECPPLLPESQQSLVAEIVRVLGDVGAGGPFPAVQLQGTREAGGLGVAASACASLGASLWVVKGRDLPTASEQRVAFARLWERESLLSGCALAIDLDEPGSLQPAQALLDAVSGVVFVLCADPVRAARRAVVRLPASRPPAEEQAALWRSFLGALSPHDEVAVEDLVSHFNLGVDDIQGAAARVRGLRHADESPLAEALWGACRLQARPRLDDLAQRLEHDVGWEDLVVPESCLRLLRQLVVQMRNRTTVNRRWGFGARRPDALGIGGLFAGASGTGKTLAALVLANEMDLDLYRVDLSQVVSKYIGETEKNLSRVFEAAESGGAILLFDEADALFGRRSEVKDSHDRYANIEVGYLLQRMETYSGLAILTTNMKDALDPAFLRRLRFVVQFPFPDAASRERMWRRIFPPAAPTDELEFSRLAQLNVAGGNIKNIAWSAAYLAAEAGQPIRMHHVLDAARAEYGKLEKTLTQAEIGGWT